MGEAEKAKHCHHCQLDIVVPYRIAGREEFSFCCHGCKNVFQILEQQNLTEYYTLKQQSGSIRPNSPALIAEKKQSFAHFDQREFLDDYSVYDQDSIKMKFYLEGVHCLACLWLIENISQVDEFKDKIFYSRLNLAQSVVEIKFSHLVSPSQIATQFAMWGYRPHPIALSSNSAQGQIEQLKKKEERTMLTRIGVAAFSAGNIMIYAVSLYGGADGKMASFFGLITLLLALPVFLYSAIPFYQSALASLRSFQVSIDLPIAFALIVGGIHGSFNALQGIPHNYFDTLSILVFLLLFSRYTVKKMGQNALEENLSKSFFESSQVLRKNSQGCFEEVSSEYLKKGDLLKIRNSEVLKADIQVTSGEPLINKSSLTGEPLPVELTIGEIAPCGTINQGSDFEGEVVATGRETMWGEILEKIQSGQSQKAPIVRQMDRIAQRLILIVFSLSLMLFLYFSWQGMHHEAFSRALALIIITCPCALGLATPLAMTRSMAQAAREGIIVKNEEIFERLHKIAAIALDKTGTITSGEIKLKDWPKAQRNGELTLLPLENTSFIAWLVHSLEKNSIHPIARALTIKAQEFSSDFSDFEKVYQIKKQKEIFGSGSFAQLHVFDAQKSYEISIQKGAHQDKDPLNLHIDLCIDQHIITTFVLSDQIRKDAVEEISWLKNFTPNLFILSGDQQNRVDQLATQCSLVKERSFGEMTPQDKHRFIKKTPYTLMVGDGANDALALRDAFVGIAVCGSAEVGLRAADIYLISPGLRLVRKSLELGVSTIKLIKRNIAFSITYNVIGASAAVLGYVDPLWAAIFMPISSLTVLASTLIGPRKYHLKNKSPLTTSTLKQARSPL